LGIYWDETIIYPEYYINSPNHYIVLELYNDGALNDVTSGAIDSFYVSQETIKRHN
jgi:hypothetical protein